jgi:acyl carrier protein
MTHNILNAVSKTLRDTLNLTETETISTDSRLKEDLGLDSMSSLTFLMALEESITGFYVDPDTLEPDHLADVKSIVSYVQHQLQAS